MKNQLHLATQYLATAGISFLDKKDDDSHTNLGFNIENGWLETHKLSENNDQLLLDYEQFSLVWKSDSSKLVFQLNEKTHQQVVAWLKQTAQTFLNKEYRYALHYELPYSIDDLFKFSLTSSQELKALLQLRVVTQLSLENICKSHGFNIDIRVWPHHFDTGIYTQIPNKDISVGLGLAIPDSVCDEHYLYASAYNNEGQINTADLKPLTMGNWSTAGFLGGVLPANEITEKQATEYFKEAINHYLSA